MNDVLLCLIYTCIGYLIALITIKQTASALHWIIKCLIKIFYKLVIISSGKNLNKNRKMKTIIVLFFVCFLIGCIFNWPLIIGYNLLGYSCFSLVCIILGYTLYKLYKG